jgi:putative PIG3 family NAD(P)H quinone oxidoreductase
MLFVDYTEGAAAQSLCLAEVVPPLLQAGQVLVKVEAFGINRADTLQRQGKYPAPPGESRILGLEMAGRVVELGDSAEHGSPWRIADKVFGLVAGGAYAEYVAIEASHLMPVPKNLSMHQASGIAEAFLTAYQSMFTVADLQAKQKVLIHAGASAVGLAAIQMAKMRDCLVAVTASSEQKLTKCAEQGADLLINYQQQDFAQVIKNDWQGCDLVIDFVAGDYLNRNLQTLNVDGTIVYLAMLAGRFADPLDMALMLGKRATIAGSTLRSRSDAYKRQLIEGFSQDFLANFASKELAPCIDTVYPANEVGLCHQRLENNDSMGKLICYW